MVRQETDRKREGLHNHWFFLQHVEQSQLDFLYGLPHVRWHRQGNLCRALFAAKAQLRAGISQHPRSPVWMAPESFRIEQEECAWDYPTKRLTVLGTSITRVSLWRDKKEAINKRSSCQAIERITHCYSFDEPRSCWTWSYSDSKKKERLCMAVQPSRTSHLERSAKVHTETQSTFFPQLWEHTANNHITSVGNGHATRFSCFLATFGKNRPVLV